ncbi:F0F1 ATP synthase subunit delta [Tumebacillus sp. DT12]|uniref:ATP synthase subunit delta n=1 Tax=Tumebacillus lacus TaxID=2995335 RepID=A0ABT3WY10_9BACL|nr:F0F1 ATP synthase subunit delta [Tumebacillus lacus]MCX7569550.1 F0F1 ATP synthase subunit delta [Tumebacillus lacus]
MKNAAVAKRYAEALIELAKGQGKTDAVEQELKSIVDVLNAHPELGSILLHPSIPLDAKKQQITDLFGGRVSDTVLNFLKVLFDARRQDAIADVYNEYVRLADLEKGRVKAEVETAVPLTEAELSSLKQTLGTNGKQVEVTTTVNPSLIGGARVRIGDRVFDYSVASQLNRFRQTLKY